MSLLTAVIVMVMLFALPVIFFLCAKLTVYGAMAGKHQFLKDHPNASTSETQASTEVTRSTQG